MENKQNLTAKVKDEPFDEKEWVYVQSSDCSNRYLLGINGQKTLICCGVNPSYASPNHLDPTMRRVDAIAKSNGYDSYIMINLYPMRATNPKDMHDENKEDKEIMEKNLEAIEELLKKGDYDIWAAWGNLIGKRTYLKECLKGIVDVSEKYHCRWYRFGDLTKSGNPRHPLFLKKEPEMEEFDIREYLEKLSQVYR